MFILVPRCCAKPRHKNRDLFQFNTNDCINMRPAISKIIFLVLAAISGGLVGLLLARFFIPRGAGLAGIGTLFGIGFFGLIIGLLAAFIFKNRLATNELNTANIILTTFSVIVFAWVVIQMKQKSNQDPNPIPPRSTTETD